MVSFAIMETLRKVDTCGRKDERFSFRHVNFYVNPSQASGTDNGRDGAGEPFVCRQDPPCPLRGPGNLIPI